MKKIPNLATCLAHFPFHAISLDVLFFQGDFEERRGTVIQINNIELKKESIIDWVNSNFTRFSDYNNINNKYAQYPKSYRVSKDEPQRNGCTPPSMLW